MEQTQLQLVIRDVFHQQPPSDRPRLPSRRRRRSCGRPVQLCRAGNDLGDRRGGRGAELRRLAFLTRYAWNMKNIRVAHWMRLACAVAFASLGLELGLCGRTAAAQAPTLYTRVHPVIPNSDDEVFFYFYIMDPCNMDLRIICIATVGNVITVSVDQKIVEPQLPDGAYCLSPPPDGQTRVSLGSLPAGTYIARVDHWHPAYDQAVEFVVLPAPQPIPVGGGAVGVLAVFLLALGARAHASTLRIADSSATRWAAN